eukprot:gene2777-1000_t
MSYWGSSYSLLGKEKKEVDGEEDENEKDLRESMSITKVQMEELKECFKICDKSGKGYVTPEEFKAVMQSVGYTVDNDDIREIFHEIDDNSSGHIDFIEFLQLMNKSIKEPITEENIRQCFEVFDKDEVGYITIKGLDAVFTSLGQSRTDEELKDMLKFFDANNEEGLIEYEAVKNLFPPTVFRSYLDKEKLLRRRENVGNETDNSWNNQPYAPESVKSNPSSKGR